MTIGRKPNLICLMVLCLALLLVANMRVLESRYLKTGEESPVASLEGVPATLALTTFALGPLRGLIVDGLWWRMIQHQDRGNYFETIQLTNWITALQPRFANVWAFGAWNLCYNVAHEFPDPELRWKWIERAISMLRDQALTYTPDHPMIRRELARIFWDRIGKRGDVSQTMFQRNWAMAILPYLPEGNRNDIMHLLDASRQASALFATPGAEALLADARKAGIDLAAAATPDNPDARAFTAFLQENASRQAVWDSLRPCYLARQFQSRFRMDLDRMLFIDKEYGPFDWRLPQAHAVYWAIPARKRFTELFTVEERQIDNIVRQSLEQAFRHGRLIYRPETGFFMTTNNLAILGRMHDYYDAFLKDRYSPTYDQLHKEFLTEAVAVLYSYDEITSARELFGHYREDYFTETYHPSFEEFCIDAVQKILLGRSYADSRAMVHAVMYQAYFSLASGDMARARGYARMARQVYDRHQREYKDAPAFLLPPFDSIKQGALEELRSGNLADFMKENLSTGTPDPETVEATEMHIYTGGLGDKGHHLKKKRTEEQP